MGAADGQYQAALCSTWPAVADGEDDELSIMMAMGFFRENSPRNKRIMSQKDNTEACLARVKLVI